MSVKVFQRGETIGLWAYIKDWEGVYTSPDNGVKVTLTDPAGTKKVDAQAMTESTVGKFVYHYTSTITDVVGWWRFRCVGQDGTGSGAKYTVVDGTFNLE